MNIKQKITFIICWFLVFSKWQAILIHELGHALSYKIFGFKLDHLVIGKHIFCDIDNNFALKPEYQEEKQQKNRVYFVAPVSQFVDLKMSANFNPTIGGLTNKKTPKNTLTRVKLIISSAGIAANFLTLIFIISAFIAGFVLFEDNALNLWLICAITLAYPTFWHAKYMQMLFAQKTKYSDIQKIKRYLQELKKSP